LTISSKDWASWGNWGSVVANQLTDETASQGRSGGWRELNLDEQKGKDPVLYRRIKKGRKRKGRSS